MALRIGIMGCGAHSGNHVRPLVENPDSELVALCDVSTEIVERFAADERVASALDGRPRPAFFTDADTMYAEAQLDAVIIATPHTTHFAHARQALANGAHIYLEKPMVTSSADAHDLERAVSASGKVLVVGYYTPGRPQFQYLRELVRRGSLGQLELVNGFVSQNWKQNTTGKWRQNPALSGGGQAYDTGAHLLNSLVWTVEAPPQRVFALIDQQGTKVDINTIINVRFVGGVMASICISGNCAAEGASMSFIFSGGRVDIDGWRGEWIRVYGSDGEEIKAQLPVESGTALSNFIDSVFGRAEAATTPRDGVNMSELMDAIYASAGSGTAIEIDPTG